MKTRTKLPAIIIDTREQTPFTFGEDIATMPGSLATGDYSLHGFTDLVAIERKSLPDLCQCITRERDRFKRELHRMQAYRCKAVIIEAELSDIMGGDYRSQVTPASVLGSIAKWMVQYQTPFIFAGDHGAIVCVSLIRQFAAYMEEMIQKVAALKSDHA